MNITYHFIGIHRHRHPSVKKLPFLPSIHQFNEHLFRKHIVFNENQFFPNFFLGFPMVSRRKKFTSQPPVAEIFPMVLHLRAVAHQKIHAGLDQRLTTGSSCFHGFRTGFHLAKFQRFETYWGW